MDSQCMGNLHMVELLLDMVPLLLFMASLPMDSSSPKDQLLFTLTMTTTMELLASSVEQTLLTSLGVKLDVWQLPGAVAFSISLVFCAVFLAA